MSNLIKTKNGYIDVVTEQRYDQFGYEVEE